MLATHQPDRIIVVHYCTQKIKRDNSLTGTLKQRRKLKIKLVRYGDLSEPNTQIHSGGLIERDDDDDDNQTTLTAC